MFLLKISNKRGYGVNPSGSEVAQAIDELQEGEFVTLENDTGEVDLVQVLRIKKTVFVVEYRCQKNDIVNLHRAKKQLSQEEVEALFHQYLEGDCSFETTIEWEGILLLRGSGAAVPRKWIKIPLVVNFLAFFVVLGFLAFNVFSAPPRMLFGEADNIVLGQPCIDGEMEQERFWMTRLIQNLRSEHQTMRYAFYFFMYPLVFFNFFYILTLLIVFPSGFVKRGQPKPDREPTSDV